MSLVPEFEEQTGIKVELENYGEDQLNQKLITELNNVILTPHNAAHTKEAMIKMATQAAQGILDFLNGKIPKYMVNPEVLEKHK